MYAGGLPYEAYIIDLIVKQESEVLEKNITSLMIYTYTIAFSIIVLLGILLQCKMKSMDDLIKCRRSFKSSIKEELLKE